MTSFKGQLAVPSYPRDGLPSRPTSKVQLAAPSYISQLAEEELSRPPLGARRDNDGRPGKRCSWLTQYGGGEEHSSSLHLHARSFESPQLAEEELSRPPLGASRDNDGKPGKGEYHGSPG